MVEKVAAGERRDGREISLCLISACMHEYFKPDRSPYVI